VTIRQALSIVLLCLLCLPAALCGKEKILQKHYGLIFGTAYGPDDRPLYGVKIAIHPVDKKSPKWELASDHRGEFAQRVPFGPADYIVTGEARLESPQDHKSKRVKSEAKVHIEADERQDVSLHFRPE
jgi:hypothetical protein